MSKNSKRTNNRKNNKKNKKNKKNQKKELPFVSICTPTFNRRPFFKATIQCYLHQDYPRHLLEWIIIDDGSDKIEDLVSDISGVKYFKYDEKMSLGKKRNLMHEKCKGDIIVYMDDDDYYPPQRVSHAVNMLTNSKTALCAGSSEIYIWFKKLQKMYQFGPYGPRHSTAGTFAFKRQLLDITSYDDNAAIAEEKHFLKNYTIPFVQLNPKYTILVFSHIHNTFDKTKLLENINPKVTKETDKSVDYFIQQPELLKFYTEEIEELLENYEPGLPKYKPDVLKQTAEIEEQRKSQMQQMNNQQKIMFKGPDGKSKPLTNEEIVALIQKQQQQLHETNKIMQAMNNQIQIRDQKIKELTSVISQLRSENIQSNNNNNLVIEIEETNEETTNEETTNEETTNEETTNEETTNEETTNEETTNEETTNEETTNEETTNE
jgi:glycosyltransferase involved in cell wall biosynthesis